MSGVVDEKDERAYIDTIFNAPLGNPLMSSLMPIFLSSLPDIISARSSASHRPSSSNSLVELLLARLDAVGLLKGRRFALIAVNC